MECQNTRSPRWTLATLTALITLNLAGCGGGSGDAGSGESGAVDEGGSTSTSALTSSTGAQPTSGTGGATATSTLDTTSTATSTLDTTSDTSSSSSTDSPVDSTTDTTASSTGDGTTAPIAQCGDGVVDEGEQCDDGNADDADACLSTCAAASCGDGVVQAGVEQCDDGNADDADACLSTCAAASCGDGVVQAGVEQCDDGNAAPGDGCNATCQIEKVDNIYLMSHYDAAGFYGYTISTNTWKTLAVPPAIALGTLTNDGKVVYMLGVDGIIHQYDPGADKWSPSPFPNPKINPGIRAFFKWTKQGFYYVEGAGNQMRHLKNGQWVMFNLGIQGADCGGSWDAAKNELYVRTDMEMGFRVIDTTSDTVVRTISDPSLAIEYSQMGSYSGGFFYVRTPKGTLKRFDAISGVKTDTGLKPATVDYNSTDTDVTTGEIYLSAYGGTTFQRYRPSDNTLTTLAKTPKSINNTTLTVMRPPLD
jgi:cysteine-rich repeat protein